MQRFDPFEALSVEPLLNLVRRPLVAASAHHPQVCERLAECTRRLWMKAENKPATRRKCLVNAFQRYGCDVCRNKRSGKPGQGEGSLIRKLLYPLRTNLYALGDAAQGEALAREG